MNAIDQDIIQRQLAYILHMGCVEVRKLAQAAGHERLADLGDALELLPRYLRQECTAEDLEMIAAVLKSYQEKHRSSFNFPALLDECSVPERW